LPMRGEGFVDRLVELAGRIVADIQQFGVGMSRARPEGETAGSEAERQSGAAENMSDPVCHRCSPIFCHVQIPTNISMCLVVITSATRSLPLAPPLDSCADIDPMMRPTDGFGQSRVVQNAGNRVACLAHRFSDRAFRLAPAIVATPIR